jgi:hypothetical protein
VFVVGHGFVSNTLEEGEDFTFVEEAAGFGGVGVVEAGDAVVGVRAGGEGFGVRDGFDFAGFTFALRNLFTEEFDGAVDAGGKTVQFAVDGQEEGVRVRQGVGGAVVH